MKPDNQPLPWIHRSRTSADNSAGFRERRLAGPSHLKAFHRSACRSRHVSVWFFAHVALALPLMRVDQLQPLFEPGSNT
jgi:hypothetical protein